MVPRGYGVAWRGFDCPLIFCAPLGLNLLIGWTRTAILWMKYKGMRQLRREIYIGTLKTSIKLLEWELDKWREWRLWQEYQEDPEYVDVVSMDPEKLKQNQNELNRFYSRILSGFIKK